MKYKVKMLVDYPDAKNIEAAIPDVLLEDQIAGYVKMLLATERDMIGFKLEATRLRRPE